MSTTYLGSSTGLRRRGVQPTGRLELNAKTADLTASAWVGRATRDFTDVDVAEVYAEASTRLAGRRTQIELPPGRYETLLPPGAVADLLIYTVLDGQRPRRRRGSQRLRGRATGRTRIGETLSPLPLTLRSDPDYPGLETVPFVGFAYSEDESSWTFDVGAPIDARPPGSSDGVLHELIRNRAHAARTGLAAHPAAGQPDHGRRRHGHPGRDDRRRPSAGCC